MSASSTLVDHAAGLLAPRFGRRGFFARSAVVGSALAVNPLGYVLEPNTAYAAVCSCSGSNCDCGSMCCDGYTEFCCTTTGSNSCPPGTLLGGWWKVDGTQFCGGARYYMDCNAPCNGCGCGGSGICGGSCSGTECGCADGSCDNRKSGCTLFRYGQCNQHEACIGPIVCRVVTCVPPWAIDPSCTGTVRVDNATAHHDRSCLHQAVGRLEGGSGGLESVAVVGWAIDPDSIDPIYVHIEVGGGRVATVRADKPRPDVAAAFPGYGEMHGFEAFVPQILPGNWELCVRGANVGPGDGDPHLGCAMVTVTGVAGFIDVPTGHQFATEIGWLVGAGIATGFGDGTFRPTAPVSRQAAAAFLRRLFVLAGDSGGPVESFPDVPPGHRFGIEIGWLAGAGIASGFPDGTFRPTEPVTRQGMAAFLHRLFQVLGGTPQTGLADFTDVPPGHQFATEIGWLVGAGIATGFGDGTFRPGLPVTRQATAAFLHRFWERLP